MAILYPDLDLIQKIKPEPTAGELHLLKFLKSNLSDEYEVFFQPFLNGDMPDIVIMRKGSGVYIIEVKDWDLDLYTRGSSNWYVETGGISSQPIKSPIRQVFKYKENLYNLHIDGLLEKRIKNPKFLSIVNCGLYFHKSNEMEINQFVREKGAERDHDKYLRFLNHFDFLGIDSLTETRLNELLTRRWLNKPSYLFSDDLYSSFRRYLAPPTHVLEKGVDINYSKEQESIIAADPKLQLRVSGVAGCGKTFTIAKRAVMAHKRHGSNVLILTFNISLKNLIKDKISRVREEFAWNKFHIIHYHEFFKSQANNLELPIEGIPSWSNTNFFEGVAKNVKKYKTIIIDEIQDFQENWVKIIRKYFLEPGGEILFFGDEKQNIYHRTMEPETKKPYTGVIGGRWRNMKSSFRMSNDIGRVATLFQKEFFDGLYDLDEEILRESQRDIFEEIHKPVLRYYNIAGYKDPVHAIAKAYSSFAISKGIHDNDITILASRVQYLREADKIIRSRNIRTNVMFESEELLKELCDKRDVSNTDYYKYENGNRSGIEPQISIKLKSIHKQLEDIRRNKKFHFYPNPGLLKLSTTHSFKGWDTHTLILIIDHDSGEMENAELLYTSITRCKENLIIINLGNEVYDDFFMKKEVRRYFNRPE